MSYPGGKGGAGVYQTIINQFPPHKTYIEAFLGGGAIMLAKKPAPLYNYGIDLSQEALDNFPRGIIPELYLTCGDAIKYLKEWCTGDGIHADNETLVYCDPPYLMSTRKQQEQLYFYELEEHDHIKLLTLIRKLPCMVAISGYYSELYSETLADWRVITFQAVTRGGSVATEYLWMNYPEPMELHDYRYLGANYRERERIKRKKERWRRRLAKMPMLERHALMMAIESVKRLDHSAVDDDAGSHHHK